MFHTTNHHPASAADGLRAYGLAGIELGHRAQTRQDSAERSAHLRQIEVRGVVGNLRQMVGQTLIVAGVELAGRQAASSEPTLDAKPSMP